MYITCIRHVPDLPQRPASKLPFPKLREAVFIRFIVAGRQKDTAKTQAHTHGGPNISDGKTDLHVRSLILQILCNFTAVGTVLSCL